MVRTTAIAVVAMATTLGLATAAIAVPPPPPNPSDSAITAGKAEVHKKASEVGSITTKLAHAKSQLQGLQDDLETKQELANKALVDQGNAQQAATKAKRNAQGAQQQAAAASAAIERAQHSLDRFASLSYEQGSTVGSVTAFVGSNSPKDVLQRSELLNAVGAAKLTALQGLQRARTAKANLDSAARSALEQANRKAAEAQQAKQAADQAKQAAVHASQAQQAQAKTIQTQMAGLQSQLGTARAKVGGLLDARAQYNQWLARKKAAEQAAARAAAARAAAARAAAARQPSNGGGQPSGAGGQQAHAPSVSHATGGGVQAVIDRAMSVLGVTYAWGGGNAYG
ncbi:MAG: coiled-coil domain-containing protein, partial [Sciscionella sp.]